MISSCSFGYQFVTEDDHASGGGTSLGGETASGGDDDGASGGEPSTPSGGAGDGGNDNLGGGLGEGTGGADPINEVEPIVHCKEIRPLDSAPVIDGEMDPGMYLEEVIPVGWGGADPIPDGVSAHYAVGWRPDGLYFFVNIRDPDRNAALAEDHPWMGDAFEIFVDHDAIYETAPPLFDPVGTRQFFVGAPSDETSDADRGEVRFPDEYSVWPGSWIAVPTSYGYNVEAFITASDLELTAWSLSVGDQVGIDLGHDVSVPSGEVGIDGNRLDQYFLKLLDDPQGDDNDFPFNNEAAFCTSTLID